MKTKYSTACHSITAASLCESGEKSKTIYNLNSNCSCRHFLHLNYCHVKVYAVQKYADYVPMCRVVFRFWTNSVCISSS